MSTTILNKELTARKDRNFLVFNNGEREIYFDLADNKFKRNLRRGEKKILADTGVAAFFRGISPHEVAKTFKNDPVYMQIIERVVRNEKFRGNANFASIFSKVTRYMHLESYMLLGIQIEGYGIPLVRPVSQFSKPVIRFMRESGFVYGSNWENAYEKHPKLVTDLCTYVMENHHDNLLVYKHLYNLLTRYNVLPKLALLVQPITTISDDYHTRGEYGFGAEYKSLFDYVMRCIAVEAMGETDVIDEYYDYLKMARKIKQLKHMARLREAGDTTTQINQIGFVDYRKIEKYPRGLTIRHRIVTRNYSIMQQEYDESKFSQMIDHDYMWGDDLYCVVTPKKCDDIKNEGTELNHCVGSYIESVLQGRTQIVFMRKKDTPEQSLITLEIRSRGIQQARGYANRDLNDDEKAWLEVYAKAKNLTYGSVKSNEDKVCPTPNPKKDKETSDTTVVAEAA